jgi:hypothetical protein
MFMLFSLMAGGGSMESNVSAGSQGAAASPNQENASLPSGVGESSVGTAGTIGEEDSSGVPEVWEDTYQEIMQQEIDRSSAPSNFQSAFSESFGGTGEEQGQDGRSNYQRHMEQMQGDQEQQLKVLMGLVRTAVREELQTSIRPFQESMAAATIEREVQEVVKLYGEDLINKYQQHILSKKKSMPSARLRDIAAMVIPPEEFVLLGEKRAAEKFKSKLLAGNTERDGGVGGGGQETPPKVKGEGSDAWRQAMDLALEKFGKK